MKIENATVLITGANRGIGEAFARALLSRGARKVYAGARDPASVKLQGVEPVRLDVTLPADVEAAAARCTDVTLLVNNAGIALPGPFLSADSAQRTRLQMETNFFGVLHMSQAFAPVLAAHGGGAVINVLSIASWINGPQLASYGASKSAAWALTNGLRHELLAQRTQVLALHMGFVDTDLTRGMDVPKTSPALIVQRALDALEAGASEVMADDRTRDVKRSLSADLPAYLPQSV